MIDPRFLRITIKKKQIQKRLLRFLTIRGESTTWPRQSWPTLYGFMLFYIILCYVM